MLFLQLNRSFREVCYELCEGGYGGYEVLDLGRYEPTPETRPDSWHEFLPLWNAIIMNPWRTLTTAYHIFIIMVPMVYAVFNTVITPVWGCCRLICLFWARCLLIGLLGAKGRIRLAPATTSTIWTHYQALVEIEIMFITPRTLIRQGSGVKANGDSPLPVPKSQHEEKCHTELIGTNVKRAKNYRMWVISDSSQVQDTNAHPFSVCIASAFGLSSSVWSRGGLYCKLARLITMQYSYTKLFMMFYSHHRMVHIKSQCTNSKWNTRCIDIIKIYTESFITYNRFNCDHCESFLGSSDISYSS